MTKRLCPLYTSKLLSRGSRKEVYGSSAKLDHQLSCFSSPITITLSRFPILLRLKLTSKKCLLTLKSDNQSLLKQKNRELRLPPEHWKIWKRRSCPPKTLMHQDPLKVSRWRTNPNLMQLTSQGTQTQILSSRGNFRLEKSSLRMIYHKNPLRLGKRSPKPKRQ